MLTRKYAFDLSIPHLPLTGARAQESLFFDIETTGFSPDTSHVYLIGAAYYAGGTWRLIQWMSEKSGEEEALLRTFAGFLKPFRTLLHFNGQRFDLPYLTQKYARYHIPSPLEALASIDIYRDSRPLRSLLGLTRLNQKSLESFLGVQRRDQYNGGQLIEVYRTWCRQADPDLAHLLLLHNREDVQGMLRLVSLYAYRQLMQPGTDAASVISLKADTRELQIGLTFTHAFPVPLVRTCEWGRLNLQEQEALLQVPVYEGELRHFFPNFRDYYYLPQEDEAIHKSVAVYVDKAYRRQATPKTCYTRHSGRFIPQFPIPDGTYPFAPLFQEAYDQKSGWLQLTPALSQSFALDYSRHLLARSLNPARS